MSKVSLALAYFSIHIVGCEDLKQNIATNCNDTTKGHVFMFANITLFSVIFRVYIWL